MQPFPNLEQLNNRSGWLSWFISSCRIVHVTRNRLVRQRIVISEQHILLKQQEIILFVVATGQYCYSLEQWHVKEEYFCKSGLVDIYSYLQFKKSKLEGDIGRELIQKQQKLITSGAQTLYSKNRMHTLEYQISKRLKVVLGTCYLPRCILCWEFVQKTSIHPL